MLFKNLGKLILIFILFFVSTFIFAEGNEITTEEKNYIRKYYNELQRIEYSSNLSEQKKEKEIADLHLEKIKGIKKIFSKITKQDDEDKEIETLKKHLNNILDSIAKYPDIEQRLEDITEDIEKDSSDIVNEENNVIGEYSNINQTPEEIRWPDILKKIPPDSNKIPEDITKDSKKDSSDIVNEENNVSENNIFLILGICMLLLFFIVLIKNNKKVKRNFVVQVEQKSNKMSKEKAIEETETKNSEISKQEQINNEDDSVIVCPKCKTKNSKENYFCEKCNFKIRKLYVIIVALFFFSNLTFAKTNQNNSVTHYKTGSYKVTAGNRSNTYDKYGKKKSSKVKDSSGNTTIKKYDKNGNVKSTKVTKPNGSSKAYDKNGKLIKKTEVTNY